MTSTRITVHVELELVKGKPQEAAWLLDYFAGNVGRENGARKPLRLTFHDEQGDVESVYVVALVTDR